MSDNSVSCPVSSEKINESVARIAAFITIIVTMIGVWFKLPVLLIVLGADFALRAFTNGSYSPVKYTSRQLFKLSWLTEKISDAAPKTFAAGLGFVFSLSIGILQLTQNYVAADAVAGILLFCAALEAFAGYCLGCVVYTFLVLPFFTSINKNNS